MEPDLTNDNGYSRAFETFVQGEDDLLGLLAYALYKKAIHETRTAGNAAPEPRTRSPSDAETRAYRSLAEDLLDAFAVSAQNSARDEILQGGFRPELISLRQDILVHIDRRTSWRSAFVVNLLAWVASIGITVLVAIVVATPSWLPAVRRALGFE